MQKFYFQAVTSEGKQISGYITAESQEKAHQKLKDSKLSVLTLEKRDIALHKEGVLVFAFEAVNNEHKTIKGTIESPDMYSAYKKLKVNYKFIVNYIIPLGISEEEKERLKKAGIDPEFEKRLNAELKIQAKKSKKSKNRVMDKNELQNILKYHEEEIGFMKEKIDTVLQEVIPLLEENIDYIDPVKYREIEERIDLLSRLKHSNSVDHLKNLTQKLLKELTSDQMFLYDANLPLEVKEEIERRRQQFVGIDEKFSRAIVSGLYELQVKFSEISVDEIKEKIASLKILDRFRGLIFSIFLSLFIICLLFWGFVFFEKFQEINVSRVSFYLSSPLLWYLTVNSAICSLWFYLLGIKYLASVKRQLITLGIGIIVLLIVLIQFPVFFFWTGLR